MCFGHAHTVSDIDWREEVGFLAEKSPFFRNFASHILPVLTFATLLVGTALVGVALTRIPQRTTDAALPSPAPETTYIAAGSLTGRTILVDPGHGGYDGGAVGRVSGTPEKGLNLDVARRLAAILEAQGAQIVMTRTDDYALCDEHPPIRKKLQDMQRRAAIIEQSGAQMVLSIHMNEYAGRSQSGPQVFYREGCPAGRLLAGAIQEAMNETLAPKKKRSALGGDYYILTLGRPSVLVECGFLSNAGEEALLLTADYRQRVAQAIARGIWAWANLPEEKPEALPAVERGGEAEAET